MQYLRIDGEITYDLAGEPGKLAKVRTLCRISKAIGVQVIIAGQIDGMELRQTLHAVGVDYAQGFDIMPVPCR